MLVVARIRKKEGMEIKVSSVPLGQKNFNNHEEVGIVDY